MLCTSTKYNVDMLNYKLDKPFFLQALSQPDCLMEKCMVLLAENHVLYIIRKNVKCTV